MDTRPKGRYDGTAPEPNPKIRSGHMHGSVSFPFTNIIDPQTKTMKDADAIKQGVYVHVNMVKLIVSTVVSWVLFWGGQHDMYKGSTEGGTGGAIAPALFRKKG